MPQSRAWRVAHASAAGTRHQAEGTGCEDYSCFLIMPKLCPDTIVAAVADGMSSAPMGGDGARIAAETACLHASICLWGNRQNPISPNRLESMLYTALLKAKTAIEEEADHWGLIPADFATTLLLAVHTQGHLAAAQVGDGAAVVSTQDGEHRTLLAPKRGEYANETDSITSRRAIHKSEIAIARPKNPVGEIFLMTDGLMNLTMDLATASPHTRFFAAMRQWLDQQESQAQPNLELKGILSSGEIAQRTDDDVTLLIAARRDHL